MLEEALAACVTMRSIITKQNCIGSKESCCCSLDCGLMAPEELQVTHGRGGSCFRQALDIARHQQAKSLELRAAMSLSRLWQTQGKRAEARQMLAEIYGGSRRVLIPQTYKRRKRCSKRCSDQRCLASNMTRRLIRITRSCMMREDSIMSQCAFCHCRP